jgi:hypothetical protein
LHPRIIAHLLSWNSLIVERRAPLEPEAGMTGLDVNERRHCGMSRSAEKGTIYAIPPELGNRPPTLLASL